MRIGEWIQANQQDEREHYYHARAGAMAWSAMSVVWASLILRYKVTR